MIIFLIRFYTNSICADKLFAAFFPTQTCVIYEKPIKKLFYGIILCIVVVVVVPKFQKHCLHFTGFWNSINEKALSIYFIELLYGSLKTKWNEK